MKGAIHMKEIKPNRLYKDRLFKFIFSDKKYALSLFNLLTDSNYTNPDELQITTLKDAFYMSMRNDLSILVHFTHVFAEQQSTFGPNTPLRLLIYVTDSYLSYIELMDIDLFSSKQQYIPKPYFYVIYNGREQKEDVTQLRLSDAYKDPINDETTLELNVKMININPGHNEEMIKKCRPLYEYAWMCGKIREKEEEMSLTERIENMLDKLPKEFETYGMIKSSRAEVIEMLSMEYDEKKHIEKEKNISYEDGILEGKEQGLLEGKQQGLLEGKKQGLLESKISIAKEMLLSDMSVEMISKFTGLSKEEIEKIQELG